MKGREGGGETFILCHTAVLFARCWETKRMKRFFWSQKGLLSFLGSLSGRDVISINYLPHQRDRNMLARFCFSHLIALFTEQLPTDNKRTHAPRCTGQQAGTSQLGHEWYTDLSTVKCRGLTHWAMCDQSLWQEAPIILVWNEWIQHKSQRLQQWSDQEARGRWIIHVCA